MVTRVWEVLIVLEEDGKSSCDTANETSFYVRLAALDRVDEIDEWWERTSTNENARDGF